MQYFTAKLSSYFELHIFLLLLIFCLKKDLVPNNIVIEKYCMWFCYGSKRSFTTLIKKHFYINI